MKTQEDKNASHSDFATRLKQLRLQKGLSQSDLGKITNTHYTQIGRYELGKAKPSSETLKLLADALDVSSDYLYDGVEEDAAVANFQDRDFLRMFEEAEKLPENDKTLIKEFLDAFLMKRRLQKQFANAS
jgi:transcriptional regulator with XRE-family HTH domain